MSDLHLNYSASSQYSVLGEKNVVVRSTKEVVAAIWQARGGIPSWTAQELQLEQLSFDELHEQRTT